MTENRDGAEAHGVALAALESERFKRVIARHPALTTDNIPAAEAFCRRAGVELLITRCSTADSASLAALQASGFRVMDTLVRWRRSLAGAMPSVGKRAEIIIRPLDASASVGIASVAQAAFQSYNGHYHADARLASGDSTALYVSWAERSLANAAVADTLLGARWRDTLVGFITLKPITPVLWEVPLAAVAPQAQRRGILTVMLLEAMQEAQRRGAEDLEYGCIVSNVGVQKALARLGFEPSESSYTLHKWFTATA